MTYKVINGIKFIPMRHIAKGTAYINPEDLETLLAGQAPRGRFIEGGIIKASIGEDKIPFTITPTLNADELRYLEICPDCGREYCFGGAVCEEMVKKAYT